jgi:hypothetical protein
VRYTLRIEGNQLEVKRKTTRCLPVSRLRSEAKLKDVRDVLLKVVRAEVSACVADQTIFYELDTRG